MFKTLGSRKAKSFVSLKLRLW